MFCLPTRRPMVQIVVGGSSHGRAQRGSGQTTIIIIRQLAPQLRRLATQSPAIWIAGFLLAAAVIAVMAALFGTT